MELYNHVSTTLPPREGLLRDVNFGQILSGFVHSLELSFAKPFFIYLFIQPRRRWEDNIKTNLEEVGRGCGDWMELAQDRDRWRALVSTVMNFRVVP